MPIMTSWGCPFDCTFCSVTAMFGKKYRFRSAESVIAELKDKRPERIFFYDDNMAANRKRLKRLLQMMIDEDLVIPWSAQVRTDVVKDPELLDLMRRSGCKIVYLGLESVNQETLDRFEKSQTVADIENAIKVLHDYDIKSHGMFVLGADDDDVQTVRDTVTFAIKNKIDTVMLNILTPLPGTLQFREFDEAGRIFDKRWELYDAHHVVFEPARMTPYELQIEVLRGYMRFYSLRTWLGYIFTFQFTKQLLFHGWGMVIIRTWRRDARNQAFIKALKRKWPRPTPRGTVRRAGRLTHVAGSTSGAPRDTQLGDGRTAGGTRCSRSRMCSPAAPNGSAERAARLSGGPPDVKVSYLSWWSDARGAERQNQSAAAGLTSTRTSRTGHAPRGGDAVNGTRRFVRSQSFSAPSSSPSLSPPQQSPPPSAARKHSCARSRPSSRPSTTRSTWRSRSTTRIHVQLSAVTSQIKENEQLLKVAEYNLGVANEQLSTRAEDIYKSRDVGVVDVLFAANSFDDLVTQLNLMERLGNSDVDTVKSIAAYQRDIKDRRVKLDADKKAAARLVDVRGLSQGRGRRTCRASSSR